MRLLVILLTLGSLASCGVKMGGPSEPIGGASDTPYADASSAEDPLSKEPVTCKDGEVMNNGACMAPPERCLGTEVYLAYLDQCVANTPENVCFSKGQVRAGDGCAPNAYYAVCILKTGRTAPQDNTVSRLKLAVTDNSCEGSYAKLSQLTSLDISEVQKEVDLRVVGDFALLEELVTERNLLTSASGIEKLKNLKKLNISDNAITNIGAIAGLTLLEDLDAEDNKIEDITPLRDLKKLRTTDLSSNKIKSLAALSGLAALAKIDLNANDDLSDLRPLRSLANLRTLRIEDTNVGNLEPLVDIPLTTLDIAGSFITTFFPSDLSEANCPIATATSQVLADTCFALFSGM